jgi:hypothetical protein
MDTTGSPHDGIDANAVDALLAKQARRRLDDPLTVPRFPAVNPIQDNASRRPAQCDYPAREHRTIHRLRQDRGFAGTKFRARS